MDFYQLAVPDEPIDPLNFEVSKAEIEEPFLNWTSWNLLSQTSSCS